MRYSSLNNKPIFVNAILHTPMCVVGGSTGKRWCLPQSLPVLRQAFTKPRALQSSIPNLPASAFPALWSKVTSLFLAVMWVPGTQTKLLRLEPFAVAFQSFVTLYSSNKRIQAFTCAFSCLIIVWVLSPWHGSPPETNFGICVRWGSQKPSKLLTIYQTRFLTASASLFY